jgi:type I site-specific restriction-modification system R (restriction) subunit
MIEGVFDRRRLLDLIGYFILFEDSGGGPLSKKIAGYHQFHASTVKALNARKPIRASAGRSHASGKRIRESVA